MCKIPVQSSSIFFFTVEFGRQVSFVSMIGKEVNMKQGFFVSHGSVTMATCFCLDLGTLVSRMSWIDEPGSPNVSFHETIKPITSQRVLDGKPLC